MNPFHITYKIARRIAISIVGMTVLLVGIVMVVTPGPALIFIPVGLAILGLEFAWARRLLERIKQRAVRAREAAKEHDQSLIDELANQLKTDD